MKLAGRTVAVKTLYDYTEEYCRDYIVQDTASADISVEIQPEDIAFERMKSEAEDRREGIPVRRFSDGYLETLAVYRKIATAMTEYDTVLFHGSVIAVDGEGYLFTAKSGTGKSTHTRLWREYFGDRAVMVNDDKPLLRITDSGVYACGTPWDGKHRLSSNISVPLKAICVLERGMENTIGPVDKRLSYPLILQQTYRPAERTAMEKTMLLADRLLDSTPVYRLRCNMEPDAARVSYEGMNRLIPDDSV